MMSKFSEFGITSLVNTYGPNSAKQTPGSRTTRAHDNHDKPIQETIFQRRFNDKELQVEEMKRGIQATEDQNQKSHITKKKVHKFRNHGEEVIFEELEAM